MQNYLPLLFILACPLMMFFMMRGMGGGQDLGAGDQHPVRTSPQPTIATPHAPTIALPIWSDRLLTSRTNGTTPRAPRADHEPQARHRLGPAGSATGPMPADKKRQSSQGCLTPSPG